MASSVPAVSINDQAAQWAVETAYGELSAEGRAELEVWLAADRRHRGAYARARAVFLAMEDAVVGARPPPRPALVKTSQPSAARPAPARRRRTGLFGAAIAASIGGLIVAAAVASFHVERPGLASALDVKLEDGSIATLAPDAQIDVALSKAERRVTLLRGDATFRVAKDQARPFIVRSGEVYAQATGTIYSVARVGARGGAVKVMEGSVLVWPGDQREQAILLRAGDSATLDPAVRPPPRPPADKKPSKGPPQRPAAPTQIALDDTPIRVAVARFNRINSTKIVLADPAIGDIRIVGLFKADDPDEFARMAAAVSDSEVERGRGVIVIKLR